MDVFSVRDRLVDDYRDFTGSFVTIHDPRVREHVEQRNASDYQWPSAPVPFLTGPPTTVADANIMGSTPIKTNVRS